MSRVLIASYYFAPMAKIGAVRWTKISKYLARMGYDIDVITTSAKSLEDPLLIRDARELKNIYYIDHKDSRFSALPEYKDAQNAAKAAQSGSGKKPLIRRVKDLIWRSSLLKYPTSVYVASQDYRRSKDFAAQAEKFISQKLDMSSYDAIICSYGPTSMTLLGLWLKKNYPQIPLIMDFRDPMTGRYPFPYNQLYGRLQSRICSAAERIITVTEGCLPRICGSKHTEKRLVVPNGYDAEDFPQAEPHREEKYTIVYTGGMYGGRADFSPLLRAISQLAESGELDLNDIRLHHVGPDSEVFRSQAENFMLGDILVSHGRLDRSEALEWQRAARLLTMFVWNTKKENGILTGKFLEYINSGSPVAAIISGDLGGSTLRRAIERGRFGIAYESVNDAVDYAALVDYIRSDYARWKQGLAADYSPDKEYAESFSYPHIAKQTAALIESVCAEAQK